MESCPAAGLSVGEGLKASAVEWKLSSSASCCSFFTVTSCCTAGSGLEAMAVLGHEGGGAQAKRIRDLGKEVTTLPSIKTSHAVPVLGSVLATFP